MIRKIGEIKAHFVFQDTRQSPERPSSIAVVMSTIVPIQRSSFHQGEAKPGGGVVNVGHGGFGFLERVGASGVHTYVRRRMRGTRGPRAETGPAYGVIIFSTGRKGRGGKGAHCGGLSLSLSLRLAPREQG